jgi:hypothetical protein
MTTARILFPQFRDEQSDSKYPFVDGATLTATNTGTKIPPDIFIDALFFGIGSLRRMYIASITVTPQTVAIVFGDVGGTTKLRTEYSTPPANGVLPITDAYGRPAGLLVAGRFDVPTTQSKLVEFSSWSLGVHTFTTAATEFVSTASVPSKEPGVRGLLTEKDELLAGDVWIVGDAGVVVRSVPETSNIRIDVIGVPLFRRFVCFPQTTFPTKCHLRTINGCPPDAYGNFTITSEQGVDHNVLRIYPSVNGTLRFDTAGPSNV